MAALNTRGGGVQKAPLSFETRVFPLWGPRAPDEPRKGKGRASRFIWGRGPKEASKRGGASSKWSPVRACTAMHARPCTGMYGHVRGCTGMHARPCTGMYGGVRPCTLGHVRPCTAAHAGGAKGRLRGPRGGEGGRYMATLWGLGVPARACAGVYGGVHALVRGCTLVPGQAGLSYKLFPRKAPCS